MKPKPKNKFLNWICAFLCVMGYADLASAQINIIAAENFYGQIAKEIGGASVSVVNVLENPQQDPHLYSVTPSIGRAIAGADIIVYNGLGYDAWMEKLLSNRAKKTQEILVVADLVGAKLGSNPHIWYNPDYMTVYAQVLAEKLIKLDPANTAKYRQQLANFLTKQRQLSNYLEQLKQTVGGRSIAATEPLFNLLATKLNLQILDQAFQQQTMNEGSPSTAAVQSLITNLQQHKIAALIYNQQVSNPLIENIKEIAKKNNIPTVGMTETMPAGLDYQTWIRKQLQALQMSLKP